MRRMLFTSAVIALAAAAIPTSVLAHGGSYRGPGDTVPAGGSGGGGTGAAPSTPLPGGPTTGQPGGPHGPGGSTPGGASTGGAGGSSGASTGERGSNELTSWEFWWAFNKEPYLDLKAAIHGGAIVTGGEDVFLGSGPSARRKDTLKPSELVIRERIVPALRRVLEKERANDIVTGALIALAKIGASDGASDDVATFERFLAAPQQEIAETAALALGILADERAVATLEHLARDDERARRLLKTNEVPYRTRAFAAYGLGLFGARSTSESARQRVATTLFELLNAPQTSTRDLRVACVTALGLTPLPIAEVVERDAGPASSRQAQIAALESFFDVESNGHLVRAHVPTAVARLIERDRARLGGLRERSIRRCLASLGDTGKERDEVRQSCVLALGRLVERGAGELDVSARARLVALADRGADAQARHFCSIALAQIGGRATDGEEPLAAVRDVRNFLGRRLTSGGTAARPWAGLAIGVMEHAVALSAESGVAPSATQKQALRASLRDARSPEALGAYAIAAAIAGDGESCSILREKLGSAPGDASRGYVAVALGILGAREAIPDIQSIVRDAKYKPDLLRQAAIGLGLLGDKDLVSSLCTMLHEAKGLSAQAAIASALGFIGDARSVDPLIEMLGDDKRLTDAARGFAAVALGIVADKETLPWNAKISIDLNYRANATTLVGEAGTGVLDIL